MFFILGADCPDTPVSDPHHFYIVDKTADNQSFVSETIIISFIFLFSHTSFILSLL